MYLHIQLPEGLALVAPAKLNLPPKGRLAAGRVICCCAASGVTLPEFLLGVPQSWTREQWTSHYVVEFVVSRDSR